MGVVVRMVELSNQFQCKQKEVLKALMKAVHLPNEKEKQTVFLKLLLTLSTYDIMFENCIEEDMKDAAEDIEKKLDKQVCELQQVFWNIITCISINSLLKYFLEGISFNSSCSVVSEVNVAKH